MMTGSFPGRGLRMLLATGLLCLTAQAIAADRVSEQLVVSGTLKTPLSLTVDDLKAFAPAQVETLKVMRGPDGKQVESTVRGVRLTALLERAVLAATDHNDWKHTVILATATDGYQVAFSWPELFDTEVGTGVFVVFERDGQPLADREGRIAPRLGPRQPPRAAQRPFAGDARRQGAEMTRMSGNPTLRSELDS